MSHKPETMGLKAEDLTIRVLEGMRLFVAHDHNVHEVINFTVETDMRTGETVVILVPRDEPHSTSARDFEPHPGFEEFNSWLFGEN